MIKDASSEGGEHIDRRESEPVVHIGMPAIVQLRAFIIGYSTYYRVSVDC